MSISRKHARLRYLGPTVTLEDLGSTNGTYINGQPIHDRTVLRSGDRFQTAAVHFKFLHEQDVESAYHLAIYELVAKDGLTEIFNKRKLEEELQRELARAVRHLRPLSLIIFDLDEFKTINDSYGHLCGDFILKQVASLARDLVRPEQVLARVGGDEFVIVTNSADHPEKVGLLAARLAETLGLPFEVDGQRVEVGASIGIALYPRDAGSQETLMRAADKL